MESYQKTYDQLEKDIIVYLSAKIPNVDKTTISEIAAQLTCQVLITVNDSYNQILKKKICERRKDD